MIGGPKRKKRTEKRPLNLTDIEPVSVEYKKDRLQAIKNLELDELDSVYKLFFQARSPLVKIIISCLEQSTGKFEYAVGRMKGSVSRRA